MIEYQHYLFTAINKISLNITKEVYGKVLEVSMYINDRSKGEHNLLLMQPGINFPEGANWSEIDNMLNSKPIDSIELIPTNNDNRTWIVEINQKDESSENVLNIVLGCRDIKNRNK